MSTTSVTPTDPRDVASADQLKRWRREGVFQPARQEHPPGRRGSMTSYQDGAAIQAAAVKASLARSRNFDHVRVDVWWRDYWVDRDRLRVSFRSLLARDPVMRGRDELAAAERIAASAADPASRDPVSRLVLRRLGGVVADAFTVYHAFATLGLGREPVWDTLDVGLDEPEPSVTELIDRATGVSRALNDRVAAEDPWLPEQPDTLTMLRQLQKAGGFDLRNPALVLAQATDDELDQARDDTIKIAEPLAVIARAAEIIYGRDIAGLGTLRICNRLLDDATGRLWLTRTMLILRPLLPPEAFDEIAEACARASGGAYAVVELHAALPQHRRFFTVDAERLLDELSEDDRERFHADVAQAIARRPQLAAAVAQLEASDSATGAAPQ